MLRSNDHPKCATGHRLDSTCSHLVPNLANKNAGNHRSWELNFQKSPRTPVADSRGGGGGGKGAGGLCPPSPLFFGFFSLFFTETKFTCKKLYLVLNEYKIGLKMLEMAILENRIFKTF